MVTFRQAGVGRLVEAKHYLIDALIKHRMHDVAHGMEHREHAPVGGKDVCRNAADSVAFCNFAQVVEEEGADSLALPAGGDGKSASAIFVFWSSIYLPTAMILSFPISPVTPTIAISCS